MPDADTGAAHSEAGERARNRYLLFTRNGVFGYNDCQRTSELVELQIEPHLKGRAMFRTMRIAGLMVVLMLWVASVRYSTTTRMTTLKNWGAISAMMDGVRQAAD